MAVPAIEIQNLTKDYPYGFLQLKKKRSLEGLTMQVQSGEVFGFLGPNGAGKSTTIKLLMRLIFPTAGTARILGKPVSDISMHKQIGYLPEQPYFYDYLTAAELLDYFARFHDFTAAVRRERVAQILKKVGLESAGRIQLRKYSKGMLQRVGLAQAILHDPSVVVLDEPMSGLDPVGRREVRDIILELKQQGKTVLFSTHILSDAEMLCDRVGVIVGGKLQGIGAPSEIVGLKAHGMEILFELPVDPTASQNAGIQENRNESSRPVGAQKASAQNASPQNASPQNATSQNARAQNASVQDASALLAKATRTGDRYRLHVEEAELYATIEQLHSVGAKILSVTQVKPSLEGYFMHLVAADRAQAAAVEVHSK